MPLMPSNTTHAIVEAIQTRLPDTHLAVVLFLPIGKEDDIDGLQMNIVGAGISQVRLLNALCLLMHAEMRKIARARDDTAGG